jgi:hypothetical protein
MLDRAARGTLEQITKEQMLAEFGEPGVQNPSIIDLIATDPASDSVVLVMIERRPWGASSQQFKQIEEKVNRYMGYALDGFLVEHYPQHEGKPVRIRLDCAEEPHGEAKKFVEAMSHAIQSHNLDFVLRLLPPPS